MPANVPHLSAAEQRARPSNRGERRAQSARSRKQTPLPEPPAPPFDIDLARPETWPKLLRISEICRDRKRNWPGILAMSRSGFIDAVNDGYIPAGVKLGAKIMAWRREDILHIVEHGVVGRREQGRRAKALAAQRRVAAEIEIPAD
jgi:predicted DNA-binding transcriptional regulator AlpA